MTTPTTPVHRSADPVSPGCLSFIVMVALGLWIALFPAFPALMVAVGVVIPPLTFLGAGRERPEPYLPPTRPRLAYTNSAFVVVGLSYRWWAEYGLITPLPWGTASVVCTSALLLAAHRFRPSGDLFHWRILMLVLYSGSALGLANMHLDDSPPDPSRALWSTSTPADRVVVPESITW